MKKNIEQKNNERSHKTIYFSLGVIFSVLGGIYLLYNIFYIFGYISKNIEYYTAYGYEANEIMSNIMPTIASSIFTPIGIFGAAIVCSFAANKIISESNK